MVKSRLLWIAVAAVFAVQASVGAQTSSEAPGGPVAHAPDAEAVLQTTMEQSTFPTVPASVVFTEYTFATDNLAAQYFGGICSYLETEMAAISPEGMNYIELPQDENPMCGYSRVKGTQAYGGVVSGNQVLTIWAFGIGGASDAGDFLRIFMRTGGPIIGNASLPVPGNVESPWTVESHDVDITEYAQTAYDLRD